MYNTHRGTYLRLDLSVHGLLPSADSSGPLAEICRIPCEDHHSPIVISILLAGLVQWRIWLLNNCPLKSLLTGMNRSKGLTTDQKQPKLIKNNRANLHLTDSGCVLLGHLPCGTMFRKSHLTSSTPLSSYQLKADSLVGAHLLLSVGARIFSSVKE